MTEKSCSRCGECCRVLPLPISGMSPEILAYYRCRGLKEDQGFILVPHDCQHFRAVWIDDPGDEFESEGAPLLKHGKVGIYCDIHDSPERPRVCQQFHGQRRGSKHVLFYIPPGCSMRRDGV